MTTLREVVEGAVNEAEEVAPVVEAPVVETPPEQVAAAPTETAEQKAGRTAGRERDDKGRLLPGAAKKPEEAAPAPVAPVVAAPEAKPIPRPSSWEKGMWPVWEKLNAGTSLDAKEARQLAEYTNKREGDYAKGVSTYKTEWESAKPLIEAMAPFMPELQQHNIQPSQWISNLGRAHVALAKGSAQEKLQMFAKLSQDYGVPLQALYDPQFAQQFVAQAVHQQPVQQPVNVEQKFEEMWAKRETASSIEQFRATKDAAGNPLYPHFDVVRPDMALLLDAGKAQDLPSAYAMSLRLHDDLWQSEQDAKKGADQTAKSEANRKAVAAAKGNAVSVKSSTPASASAQAKGLRSTIAEAVDQHTSSRV